MKNSILWNSFLGFAFLLLTTILSAQPHFPITYGNITAEEQAMTVCEYDSSAAAVILGDFGHVVVTLIEGSYQSELYIHRRIKILKESAIDQYGDIVVSYYSKADTERVLGLRANVFSPGEVDPIEISGKKKVFTEKINDYYSSKTITLPDVQVGSIIEYRYRIRSRSITSLDPWFFQGESPILHSQLTTELDGKFAYSYFLQMDASYDYTQPTSDTKVYRRGNTSMTITPYKFSMKNAPAVKKGEPYITTLYDYLASVEFQLVRYNLSGIWENSLSTWEELGDEILSDNQWGQQYKAKRNHKKLVAAAAPILDQVVEPLEKMQLLYDFVNNNVKFSGSVTSYIKEQNIDIAFEKKEANSAELNLMLLTLLRKAGIESHMVWLSCRSNGRIYEGFPIRSQFDFLMIRAVIDNRAYFLDCGDPLRPMGYPRIDALNQRGWLITKGGGEWIDIESPQGRNSYFVQASIDSEGTLRGTMRGKYDGYNARPERRKNITEEGGTHWKKRLESNSPDFTIDAYKTTNLENVNESFMDSMAFHIPSAAMVTNDRIYCSPLIYSDFTENPLKSEKRNYPVDISYPHSEKIIVMLRIPEGYEVEELPESVNFKLPNNGGSFKYVIQKKSETEIQLMAKFDLKQLHFEVPEYPNLRELFSLIEEKFEEQVILVKKT